MSPSSAAASRLAAGQDQLAALTERGRANLEEPRRRPRDLRFASRENTLTESTAQAAPPGWAGPSDITHHRSAAKGVARTRCSSVLRRHEQAVGDVLRRGPVEVAGAIELDGTWRAQAAGPTPTGSAGNACSAPVAPARRASRRPSCMCPACLARRPHERLSDSRLVSVRLRGAQDRPTSPRTRRSMRCGDTGWFVWTVVRMPAFEETASRDMFRSGELSAGGVGYAPGVGAGFRRAGRAALDFAHARRCVTGASHVRRRAGHDLPPRAMVGACHPCPSSGRGG